MKKQFMISMLMASLWCCYSFAGISETDDIIPMLADGKTWTYKYHHYNIIERAHVDETGSFIDDKYTTEEWTVRFTLRGDTVIGGKHYYKNYCSEDGGEEVYNRAMREDGKCVYQILGGNNSESVCFDYTYKNMVRTLGIPGEIIEVVDSIMVKGRTYARHNYYWENVVNNPEARVVEGVGRNDTGLMCGTAGLFLAYLMDYMEFEACYENGECIFSNRDFYVPSVTDGIKTAPTSHLTPSPLYDLQGRRVSGEPRRGGIYISGGRKIVK